MNHVFDADPDREFQECLCTAVKSCNREKTILLLDTAPFAHALPGHAENCECCRNQIEAALNATPRFAVLGSLGTAERIRAVARMLDADLRRARSIRVLQLP